MEASQLQLPANIVASALGALGLLPFWGLAVCAVWLDIKLATEYLVGYGAVILTFVGAIWWGIALTAPQNSLSVSSRGFLFVWSVVPSMFSWFVLTIDIQFALVGLALFFALQLLFDFIFLRRAHLIGKWFWRLRIVLTFGAVPVLLIAGVFS